MNWFVILALPALVLVVVLAGWRELDRRADEAVWRKLAATVGPASETFDPNSIADLPEPARRYFQYIIQPGARLHRAVEIEMAGQLGLGTRTEPNYRPMNAQQILAPPYGLLWRPKVGPLSGSDAATPATSWTRFWLFGLVPIVRAGGNEDHHRSAFGRVVAEAAIWAPASLLPSESVEWQPLDSHRARAIVTFGRFEQAVEIAVADDGQPTRVVIQRWSNENAEKTFREQPFGGDLSAFRDFDGYRLPTVVDGGNHIGTELYFPFYKAKVTSLRFLPNDNQ